MSPNLTQPVAETGRTEFARQGLKQEYAVSTLIEAGPERIWQVLTSVQGFTAWNSTVLELSGELRPGGSLTLVSKIAPKQRFKLKVAEFEPPRRMVWTSGQAPFFSGVRSYSLEPKGRATVFTMREVFQGLMLPLIAPSLPDFKDNFATFAADLKREAEASPAPQ